MIVKVIPNSPKFAVEAKEGGLVVRVKSKPEGGRANAELAAGLSKLLGARVSVVRGLKGRKKEVVVEGMEDSRVLAVLGAGVAEPGQSSSLRPNAQV